LSFAITSDLAMQHSWPKPSGLWNLGPITIQKHIYCESIPQSLSREI